jgi:hypothetical protein
LPEEVFLTEGLQVIKRGIAGDIFKYVDIPNVKFIENYKLADSESYKELEHARSKKEVSAMEMSRSDEQK